MKLYHGTCASYTDDILAEGLSPRGDKESNWEVESRSDCVYLTDAYAGYFALAAGKEPEYRWLIVEVDTNLLDTRMFLPDEDFLEQCSREDKLPGAVTMQQRTKWFRDRLEDFACLWEDSMRHLGNCCHLGVIPASACKVWLFDWKQDDESKALACNTDPTICPMNYRIMGEFYRDSVKQIVSKSTLLEGAKA